MPTAFFATEIVNVCITIITTDWVISNQLQTHKLILDVHSHVCLGQCDNAKLPMPSDKPQVSPGLELLRCGHYHYHIIQKNDVIFIIIMRQHNVSLSFSV